MARYTRFAKLHMLVLWILVSALFALGTNASAQNARTIIVNSLLDDPRGCPLTCTLRSAISSARDGYVIGFAEGLTGTITLVQPLEIVHRIDIQGPGPEILTVSIVSGEQGGLIIQQGVNVRLSGLQFARSSSTLGARFSLVNLGRVEITNAVFTGVTFRNDGVFSQTPTELSEVRFSDYADAPMIEANSNTEVRNSVFTRGTINGQGSDRDASLIYVGIMGFLALNGVVIEGNSSDIGPIVLSDGYLIVRDTIARRNEAEYVITMPETNAIGEIYILGSTFAQNSGGGIRAVRTEVVNSTFSENGTYALQGQFNIYNSTIAFNPGGGILSEGTTLLGNTIVYGNTMNGQHDLMGNVTSVGNNLIGDPGDTTGWFASDLLSADPLLSELADNGGDTPTLSLGEGSPAIDRGYCLDEPRPVAIDQRGFMRNIPCDIGAFEFGAIPPTATPTLAPSPTSSRTPVPSETPLRTLTPTVIPTNTLPPTAANAQVTIQSATGIGDITSETITLFNPGATLDITGWRLVDGQNNTYTFSTERRLFSNATLLIRSGSGQDGLAIVFWNRDQAVLEPGDTLTLLDRDGRAQAIFRVPMMVRGFEAATAQVTLTPSPDFTRTAISAQATIDQIRREITATREALEATATRSMPKASAGGR